MKQLLLSPVLHSSRQLFVRRKICRRCSSIVSSTLGNDDDKNKSLSSTRSRSRSIGNRLVSGNGVGDDACGERATNNNRLISYQHQTKQHQCRLPNPRIFTSNGDILSSSAVSSRSLSTTLTMMHGNSHNKSIYTVHNNNARLLRSTALHQQRREMSSWLPEVVQNFSVWGGSGFMLRTLHDTFHLPYWACFSTLAITLRLMLSPLVWHGANTSSKMVTIIPDLQFLLSLFQRDMEALRKGNAPVVLKTHLMRTNISSFRALYKLQNINPLSILYSPLAQLPFFWYVSIDLRKIVNGLDPALAQSLVESTAWWVPDLTDPDPWYGLPVLAGVMLYANVEASTGRRNLAAPAVAKADTALLLKDAFQSLAIFMPCFTAQLAGGIQVYIVTSFVYTIGQSVALRDASFRSMVGLPALQTDSSAIEEASVAKQMIRLKQLELAAKKQRGVNGRVLGKGTVLALGAPEVSFTGTSRPTSIDVVSSQDNQQQLPPFESLRLPTAVPPVPQGVGFIPGVSAPPWQLEEQQQKAFSQQQQTKSSAVLTDDDMEQANLGKKPKPAIQILPKQQQNNTTTATSPAPLRRHKKQSTKNKRTSNKR